MLTYVDSSAIVKLILDEHESERLAAHLFGSHLATSALSRIEVSRAVARVSVDDPSDRIKAVLSAFNIRAVDDEIVASAATLEPASTRSLDAIHLATALGFEAELEQFVAYDRRLLGAAQSHGIATAAPGR